MEKQAATQSGSAPRELVISHVTDAPRELVYKAWSEADRLKEWWGPKGFGLRVVKLDFRPGGIFHYAMQAPSGQELFGRFMYRDMEAPGRIEFINSFSDAEGGITRAPFSAFWPLEVLNTLTLTEHDGKTTLTLRGGPINATEAEQKTFEAGFDSMQQGFAATFGQLTDYLARQK